MIKQIPFLDLKLANAPIEQELKQAAIDVISSGRYLHGQQTQLLEQEIATLCGTRHCVAVSNGLDALRLILRAYIEMGRLHEGDAVIVPGNTFVASVLAVSDNRLTPVMCDPRTDTMNLDSDKAAQLIQQQGVRAIMPVHLYGTPCWDRQLCNLAREHDLLIIEDNAQAIGAMAALDGLNGTRQTGGLGHAAGISFYPTKNLGALGDAGAVTTSDDELAATVRALANYGSDRRYHNIMQGLNCRIDELQAAMLRVKLRHLAAETHRRNLIASTYQHEITNPLVTVPTIFDGTTQVWHQYVIRVQQRDRFRQYMEDHGVGTDIHYATPAHLQPCYLHLAAPGTLPVTETLASEVVSLPIAHPITAHHARHIAHIINLFN
ncbi:MAG: DegT/DnrJ/EryC1/StrS family aminotransferase [Muribaculaceae bacterium]|nr:DegT/DnrJ/EryC1/StrS family aminotransferase [Muribaculaceae bacterium]